MAALDFRVLGPLEVRRDGVLLAVPAPKQRALLGLLLLHANQPLSQDDLINHLWGDEAPRTARASLQNQVYALRRLLGPETLQRQPGGYVLHVESGDLDLERFERLVAEARTVEPKERAVKLREALALWRGPALVEFPSEPFAEYEITRLEEERLAALEDRIDVDLELGRHAELIPELESLVERHPLRERIWGELMLALYRAGRQADALATYRRAHRVFVDELGVEPGVQLRELQRAILVQDAALDDPEHRPGWTLERAAAILPMHARDRAKSLFEYGVALTQTGEMRRAVSTLEAAERLAAEIGAADIEERARLYLSYLSIWTDGASPSEFLSEAEQAARRFEERGDAEGAWLALRQQAQWLDNSGRSDAAFEVAKRCAKFAAESGNQWHRAMSRTRLAPPLARGTAPVDDAIAWCERELDEAASDDMSPFGVWFALVSLMAQAGRIDEARTLAARAIATARREGRVFLLNHAIHELAEAELIAGNLIEAAEHLRSAYAVADADDDRVATPVLCAELACVLALRGDTVEARQLALRARATASPHLLATETLWRRALALVAAQEGDCDEAVKLSGEARARVNDSDWLTVRGQTLEEAAIVHKRCGDDAGEVEALREALAVYERKGNVVGAARVRQALG
jgi:DNA-binding SARP family transcriptional activator